MFKVENMTYRYPKNSEDTIKGISFEIGKGEIFGFLGPSGAGKSTTQKIMIKVLEVFDLRKVCIIIYKDVIIWLE